MNVALWLFDHGVGVFPLKDRSKEPACRWTEYAGTRAEVQAFGNYGVRLGTLGVLDPDSIEMVQKIKDGTFDVPFTPFQVLTSRGLHMYYRLHTCEGVPKFVRRQGTSVEFRNKGQYVVGAGSIHPTGAVYTERDWSWKWEDIPFFPVDTFNWDDGTVAGSLSGSGKPFELPNAVYEPERHETLNSLIASYVCSWYKPGQEGVNVDDLREGAKTMSKWYAATVCRPALPWGQHLNSFFHRSFNGALSLRLRDRKPVILDPMGGD